MYDSEQCKYHSQCVACWSDNDGGLWCWRCVNKEGVQMSMEEVKKPKAINCTQKTMKKCKWGACFDKVYWYCNYMGDHREF